MDECAEVAATMLPAFLKLHPKAATHAACVAFVRARMEDDTETVISNVAWVLFNLQSVRPDYQF